MTVLLPWLTHQAAGPVSNIWQAAAVALDAGHAFLIAVAAALCSSCRHTWCTAAAHFISSLHRAFTCLS